MVLINGHKKGGFEMHAFTHGPYPIKYLLVIEFVYEILSFKLHNNTYFVDGASKLKICIHPISYILNKHLKCNDIKMNLFKRAIYLLSYGP